VEDLNYLLFVNEVRWIEQ